MPTANFIGDGNHTIVAQLCSSRLTAGLHGHLIFISILNSFLSLTAFLGNALILIALYKESSLHPPSKLLLRCLATSDLCVGLISEPLAVTSWMSIVNEHWNICGFVQTVNSRLYNNPHFDWSVSVDIDCNKRGQTSRPDFGTEIQTSCNFKANLCASYFFLCCANRFFSAAVLEIPYSLSVFFHIYITMSTNLSLLLHKDFPPPSSSSKSGARPCSTTESSKSTEHGAIQKGSVHCNMAATDAGRLLSTQCHSDSCGS